MSDEDEAPAPLARQGTGLSLSLPEADGDDRGDLEGGSGQMAELLLALEDGQEWKTSVDISYTVEFVKALARDHFAELKNADCLVRCWCTSLHEPRSGAPVGQPGQVLFLARAAV
jgi:hypothetical protein